MLPPVRLLRRQLPGISVAADYSTIVNVSAFLAYRRSRRCGRQGASVVPLTDASADADNQRFPPVALLGVNDAMRVMQEILIPILPLVPYSDGDIAAAIAYVNVRPRPLALYVFDNDCDRGPGVSRRSAAVSRSMTRSSHRSGCAPFGGVGPNGMGHYHGHDGFLCLQQAEGVSVNRGWADQSFQSAVWQTLRVAEPLAAAMIGRREFIKTGLAGSACC